MTQGNVLRWHAHPLPALRESGDDIRGHMYRVSVNCFCIAEAIGGAGFDPRGIDRLMNAAETHDLPELIMGDWPFTLTRDYWVARVAKRILEWQIKRRMGLKWKLTRQEKMILALADKADAILWASEYTSPSDFAHYFSGDVLSAKLLAMKLGPKTFYWLKDNLWDAGIQ